jgi:hypothetical protein
MYTLLYIIIQVLIDYQRHFKNYNIFNKCVIEEYAYYKSGQSFVSLYSCIHHDLR